MTRRDFSKTLATGLTTSLFTGNLRGANDKINIGIIGLGNMGYGHLKQLIEFPKVREQAEVVMVCDVWDLLTNRAIDYVFQKTERYIAGCKDFRDLLANRKIDAVFIATPDHWHAIMTVEACKAGKDVYVQKPISVDTHESLMMVKAVRKYRRVCQVGTQQPSWAPFKGAIALVHSGILGKISEVECYIHGVDMFPGPFTSTIMPVPRGLNWPMWLGPIPKPPFGPSNDFNPDIFGLDSTVKSKSGYGDNIGNIRIAGTWRVMTRPFGGFQTDWGIHLVDIVLRVMAKVLKTSGVNGPIAVISDGGNFIYEDKRQLPDGQDTIWKFPTFNCTFCFRSGNNFSYETTRDKPGRDHCMVFHGTNGTLLVNRSGSTFAPWAGYTTRVTGKVVDPPVINGETIPLELNYESEEAVGKMQRAGDEAHVLNFLECIRSRKDPIAPIEGGRYATDMCIAAMAAYWTKRRLDWNPETGTTSEKSAHPYLKLKYRNPWKLEL